MAGPALYAELEVRVRGEADARTGYLVSIAEIDRAVRRALPTIAACGLGADGDDASWAHRLLERLAPAIASDLGRPIASLHLRLTRYHTVSLEPHMTTDALVTRRFDFCAAHRLHLPELSDAENLALFGQCSHPSGHGHNYRLEVTISAGMGRSSPSLEQWSEVVRREVVDRYDHRNLNVDCPEFGELNPSVENIARVCHERLLAPLQALGAALRRVRVWESEKTWCEVP